MPALKSRWIRLGSVMGFALLAACSEHPWSIPTRPAPPPYALALEWGAPGSAAGQFDFPRDVALAPDGKVYVADAGNHRIQAFTATGAFLFEWGDSGSAPGQFHYPMHVAVDRDGNIYVADIGDDRIQKFAGDGTYLTQWGTSGSGNGQFRGPWALAVDSGHDVYVTDPSNHRVQKFSDTGTYLTQWTVPGPGRYETPRGVAVDDSGNVYVVMSNDGSGGYPCVQKFDADGALLSQWGSIGRGNGEFFDPDGIALDAAGNVFVTDGENWRIQEFTHTGAYVGQWPSGGDARGVCAPGGIAVAPNGNVYVAEWNFCCRIQVFAPTH